MKRISSGSSIRARRFVPRRRASFPLGATALVVALAVFGAACGDDDGGSSSDSGDLPGTSWNLADVDGSAPAPDAPARIEFGPSGAVSGTSGCNSFNGPYEVDGDSLSIGPVASTLRACPGPIDEQEQAFLAALEATEGYDIADDVLTLLGGDDETLATFDRFDASLPGSSWTANSYNNGSGGLVSLVGGTEITAEFGTDGTLSGTSGCNSYSGAYEIDGDSISIGAVAATEMACLDPEGVMEQEQQYLQALQTTATWALEGTELVLRTSDGANAARFSPA